MSQIVTGFQAGIWGGVKVNSQQQNFGNNAQRQSPSYANNTATSFADLSHGLLAGNPTAPPSNPDEVVIANPNGYVAPGHYTDYHERIWVIPNVLSLSNPQLNTPIPFAIWQTFPTTQTLTAIDVDGSEVLTYDLEVNDELHDHEFRTVNLEIGGGEAIIDALTTFSFDDGDGFLSVQATVSDTFDLLYNSPVIEIWQFLTDVLTSYNNTEQRISLRPTPRIFLDISVSAIDLIERRRIYTLLMKNMKVQALIPFFQYITNPNGVTNIGGSKIFFNPALTNMREGYFLIALQETTGNTLIANITTLESDGAIIGSSSSFDIDETWIIAPVLNCLLQDSSGFNLRSISADFKLQAETTNEPELTRPGTTAVISTFDGYPYLEQQPLMGAEEKFAFRRDVIDNKTGARSISSSWPVTIVGGRYKFIVNRYKDYNIMDYWRKFFDTVKGSHKKFLMSTWLPDLTLVGAHNQGVSTLTINESDYSSIYFPHETFKRIQIEFSNGEILNTKITAAEVDEFGVATISFSPSLPDEAYTTDIERISYLKIVRAGDNVRLEHDDLKTTISFAIRQVDL